MLHEGYLGAVGAFFKNEECDVFTSKKQGIVAESDWVQKLTKDIRSLFSFTLFSQSEDKRANQAEDRSHNEEKPAGNGVGQGGNGKVEDDVKAIVNNKESQDSIEGTEEKRDRSPKWTGAGKEVKEQELN